jgi:hypothetical protein
MKYALLLYAAPDAGPHDRDPAYDRLFPDWVAYTQAMKDAGVVLGAERLRPAGTATTVRWQGDGPLLTDGPFIETKEHLVGFYLVDVPDLDAAVEWAAKMPAVRYGTIEVRPLVRDGG